MYDLVHVLIRTRLSPFTWIWKSEVCPNHHDSFFFFFFCQCIVADTFPELHFVFQIKCRLFHYIVISNSSNIYCIINLPYLCSIFLVPYGGVHQKFHDIILKIPKNSAIGLNRKTLHWSPLDRVLKERAIVEFHTFAAEYLNLAKTKVWRILRYLPRPLYRTVFFFFCSRTSPSLQFSGRRCPIRIRRILDRAKKRQTIERQIEIESSFFPSFPILKIGRELQ